MKPEEGISRQRRRSGGKAVVQRHQLTGAASVRLSELLASLEKTQENLFALEAGKNPVLESTVICFEDFDPYRAERYNHW